MHTPSALLGRSFPFHSIQMVSSVVSLDPTTRTLFFIPSSQIGHAMTVTQIFHPMQIVPLRSSSTTLTGGKVMSSVVGPSSFMGKHSIWGQ